MKEFRFAIKNTVPIFFTYLFIGIAFGMGIDLFIRGAIFYKRYRSGVWKQFALI